MCSRGVSHSLVRACCRSWQNRAYASIETTPAQRPVTMRFLSTQQVKRLLRQVLSQDSNGHGVSLACPQPLMEAVRVPFADSASD